MSSRNTESLSAMLDNEADELELRRVLSAVDQDSELVSTWARMSLVQSILHDDNLRQTAHTRRPDTTLAASVAAAVAHDAAPAASRPAFPRWSQPLARVGIAAAVALAFFIGVQTDLGQGSGNSLPTAQQGGSAESGIAYDTAQSGIAAFETADSTQLVREVDPQARQRLEEYIRSVSITRDEPAQLEQLQDSPLYRLVNEFLD